MDMPSRAVSDTRGSPGNIGSGATPLRVNGQQVDNELVSSSQLPTNLDEQPLPLSGTVLFRSVLAGFVAGTLIGAAIGSLAAAAPLDMLYFGVVGAAIGAIYGTPVGMVLGVFMAVWFKVSNPHRATVRITVTAVSIAVSAVMLAWSWPEGGFNVQYLTIPLIGATTWFGLAIVLKPSRPDAREDHPKSDHGQTISWDRDVDSDS